MVYHNYILTNRNLRDLNPIVAGEEACLPRHSFGPAIRRYTLIHYVLHGEGTLYVKEGIFPVKAGQAFLIYPDEVTTYTADANYPWHYQWIGFDGELSEKFKELPRVFSINGNIFTQLLNSASTAELSEYRIAADLFHLYCSLFRKTDAGNDHVQRIIDHIHASYMKGITVSQIASEMNLDRRYLTRIFHKRTGKSIQQYLLDVRLAEACQYLAEDFSIQETASLCGYQDVSNFSKMFKRKYKISPKHWKELKEKPPL